jgi:WD40 repeat protein
MRDDAFLDTQTASASAAAEPRADDAPAPTVQVRDRDRYLIIGEHGRGGLGKVTRAHDRELGRDVAIKELLARTNLGELRFLREALITARLEHPGIVPVHEAGRWPDGTPFYAMKLVAGRPLRELIAESTDRLGLLHHVIAVADAMAYAHERNIIHRDLKPANVIVGEFGETVVIDWGLAKDLSERDHASPAGGPFRANPASDLTQAGSILGTPAYMAPEQERGEHVDHRADVFALGNMLWELCAVEQPPPELGWQRRRALRRAGIDPDLIAIIDKAIDRDPARRYPTARPLAADLKAFKAGARIAARTYSLTALLAHWTRRHRAAALSVVAAAIAVIAGVAIYVRDVSRERGRADRALERVAEAQRNLEAEHAALTLKHAQLLLTSDPSAAVDVLATYRGAERERADQLAAEARGRGVALTRATPHTDNVLWMLGTPHGVLSIGRDGVVALTDGDRTRVLARDAAPSQFQRRAPGRGLVAYPSEDGVGLLDTARAKLIATPAALRLGRVADLAFSADEQRLAVLTADHVVRVFDVARLDQPRALVTQPIAGSVAVGLVGDALVVGTTAGLAFVRARGTETLALPELDSWAVGRDAVVLATAHGDGLVVRGAKVSGPVALCPGGVTALAVIPNEHRAAYTCKAGDVGIWNLDDGTRELQTHVDAHADVLAVSDDGSYLLVGTGDGALVALDRVSKLVSTYRGHGFRLVAVAGPSAGAPVLLSGDVRGGLRSWPLPARAGAVIAALGTPIRDARPGARAHELIASVVGSELLSLAPGAAPGRAGPHERLATFLAPSPDRRTLATYGLDDRVELWAATEMTRTRLIETGQGMVAQAEPTAGGLISAGRDGRLLRWPEAGGPITLARLARPITRFAAAGRGFVIATDDGALWGLAADGEVRALLPPGEAVTRLVADASAVYAGDARGAVTWIDAATWRVAPMLRADAAIRDIVVGRRYLAVATNGSDVQITERDAADPPLAASWRHLALQARQLAFAEPDLLVAATTDGTAWFYDVAARRWAAVPTGKNSLTVVATTADGQAVSFFDTEGRAIWFEIANLRHLLFGNQPSSRSFLQSP